MEICSSVRRVKAPICAIDVLSTRMRFMTLVIRSGHYKHERQSMAAMSVTASLLPRHRKDAYSVFDNRELQGSGAFISVQSNERSSITVVQCKGLNVEGFTIHESLKS